MGRSLTGLAIVVLLASGCATRGALGGLDREMARLRADLVDLRHAQQLASRDLERVRDELRALESRSTKLQALARDTTAALDRLRQELAPPAEAPQARVTDREPSDLAPPAAAAAAVAVPAAPSTPAERIPVAATPEVDPGPEAQYRAALAAFRAGEHGQAVLDFMDFIARRPRHPLAVNAQYWIAEAYYAERDFRHALVEFQKVLEIGPRTAKAGDALVKMGYCHVKLKDGARARATWERVVREYPRTEAAVKARALLASGPPR